MKRFLHRWLFTVALIAFNLSLAIGAIDLVDFLIARHFPQWVALAAMLAVFSAMAALLMFVPYRWLRVVSDRLWT